MVKVLISDKLSPLAAKLFADRGIEADVKPGLEPAELKACIGAYQGLAVRSATKVDARVLEAAQDLKVVAAFADDAPMLKRFRPAARGRISPIKKRSCHITIAVDEEE